MNGLMSKGLAFFYYHLGAFIFYSSLGRMHIRLHEYGVIALRRAADSGHSKAAFLLGLRLKYKGTTKAYQELGIEYLRVAVLDGSGQSQFMLAEALSESALDSEAEQEIVCLYKKAAKQDHKMAALRLSKAYEQGLFGLTINQNKAEYWSQKFLADSDI